MRLLCRIARNLALQSWVSLVDYESGNGSGEAGEFANIIRETVVNFIM